MFSAVFFIGHDELLRDYPSLWVLVCERVAFCRTLCRRPVCWRVLNWALFRILYRVLFCQDLNVRGFLHRHQWTANHILDISYLWNTKVVWDVLLLLLLWSILLVERSLKKGKLRCAVQEKPSFANRARLLLFLDSYLILHHDLAGSHRVSPTALTRSAFNLTALDEQLDLIVLGGVCRTSIWVRLRVIVKWDPCVSLKVSYLRVEPGRCVLMLLVRRGRKAGALLGGNLVCPHTHTWGALPWLRERLLVLLNDLKLADWAQGGVDVRLVYCLGRFNKSNNFTASTSPIEHHCMMDKRVLIIKVHIWLPTLWRFNSLARPIYLV